MRRGALENEAAYLTTRRSENQASAAGANAALDVAEILLEDLDRQTEITPEFVELPLSLS